MASIQEYLDLIKNAIYGKDVRQAIHDGIQQCYYDGKAGSTDLEARQRLDSAEGSISSLGSRMSTAENDIDVLDSRVDEIVAPSGQAPSAAEVTDARVGADGQTYTSLGGAIRGQVTDLKNDLNQYQTEFIACESGTYANAQKQDNNKRIRNTIPIAIVGYTSITIPTGYEAYIYRLNKEKAFISVYSLWKSGTITISDVITSDTKYINLVIKKSDSPDSDISAYVNAVANGLVIDSEVNVINSTISQEQTNFIACESGTYANAQKQDNNKRIRNVLPIAVDGYTSITVPDGYEAYIYRLNKSKGFISAYSLWVSGTFLINTVKTSDTKYINLAIKKTDSPDSDISSYVTTVANGLVPDRGVAKQAEVDEISKTVAEINTAFKQVQTGYIACESGTYANDQKQDNVYRIRNSSPVSISGYTSMTVPHGYEAYILRLDDSMEFISGYSLWVSGTVLIESIKTEDTKYINIIIKKTGEEESDISSYVGEVENGLILDNGNVNLYKQYAETEITEYLTVGLPVLNLTGDMTGITKENAVNMQYAYKDSTGSCTLKWQGASSLAYQKKNYTIKFASNVTIVSDWGSHKKYVLKANYIDPTHARNVVSCKLWGQIVKSRTVQNENLYDLPNGGAIDGFPIILVINGMFHGLYTFNIPKDDWMFGMTGTVEHECIVSAEDHTRPTRFKETITAADLEAGTYFEVEYTPDDENIGWVATSLSQAITTVMNSTSASDKATISQYVDIDSAIDYYIFMCLILGIDCTDKNYLLVTFDGTKWIFSAYDLDSTYGIHWAGGRYLPSTYEPTFHSFAVLHKMMNWIYNYDRAALKARYAELRADILSVSNVANMFYNFGIQIPKPVKDMEYKRWNLIPATDTSDIAQLVSWYTERVKIMDAEIDALT